MKNTKKIFEQRKHKRFQVKDGAYTVLRYKPVKMGKIINMSRDGLAVYYPSDGQQMTSETSELDIFIIDSYYYIEKIQVKTISDFELADKHPFSSKKIRQRCFQFGKTRSSQLFYLDYFLENFTMPRRSNKDRRQLDAYQCDTPERRNGIERIKTLLWG